MAAIFSQTLAAGRGLLYQRHGPILTTPCLRPPQDHKPTAVNQHSPEAFCVRGGVELQLRICILRRLVAQLPNLCPGERHCLYYSRKQHNLSSSLEGETVSVSPECLQKLGNCFLTTSWTHSPLLLSNIHMLLSSDAAFHSSVSFWVCPSCLFWVLHPSSVTMPCLSYDLQWPVYTGCSENNYWGAGVLCSGWHASGDSHIPHQSACVYIPALFPISASC